MNNHHHHLQHAIGSRGIDYEVPRFVLACAGLSAIRQRPDLAAYDRSSNRLRR